MAKEKKQSLSDKYERALEQLDSLVRAVESGDTASMESVAGSAREFLDKDAN